MAWFPWQLHLLAPQVRPLLLLLPPLMFVPLTNNAVVAVVVPAADAVMELALAVAFVGIVVVVSVAVATVVAGIGGIVAVLVLHC